VALLDLGNPDARAWITDLVSGMVEELGMSYYRQDMNTDPLPYWHHADGPDRQGMTEIRYIEGLYAFWDELRRRHPHLIIDNCATGGRRLDLETVSRSVSLWRSDYSDPIGVQSHGFALAAFIPTTAGAWNYFDRVDDYVRRSAYGNGVVAHLDILAEGVDVAKVRDGVAEMQALRPLYFGDFHPLTLHSASPDAWLAYQMHREDLGRGMVLVFRRKASCYERAIFPLAALHPEGRYTWIDHDAGTRGTEEGAKLLEGLAVTIDERESSRLFTYELTEA
jgi:alpha-galactosidase